MVKTTKKELRDVYFAGTVLPAGAPSDPTDAADPTFRFTDYERRNLDLKGIPIVAEHSKRDRDVVGRCLSSYVLASGETVVMGKIDGKSMKSIFARHAVGGEDPWYPSLSLCHAHTRYEDGSSAKIAKEISICKTPRREGSSIFIVDGKQKTVFKEATPVSKMSPATDTPVTTPATAEKIEATKIEEPKVIEHSASSAAIVAPVAAMLSPDMADQLAKMQEIVIAQEQALELERGKTAAEVKKTADLAGQLSVIHEAAVKKERTEKEAAQAKADLIAKSLVDSLAAELPMGVDDALKESFTAIAQMAPKHARAVYELMHEASVRHKNKHSEYEQALKDAKHAVIQSQFDNIMTKHKSVAVVEKAPVAVKRKAAAVVSQTTHEAASDSAWLRKAMRSHKRSGSVRSSMGSLQERNRELFEPTPGSYSKRRRF